MHQALELKYLEDDIPSERTVYRIMEKAGINYRPRRIPIGITKADMATHRSEDLLRRNFRADEPLKKCVTDITEIPASDGKVYVSAFLTVMIYQFLGSPLMIT